MTSFFLFCSFFASALCFCLSRSIGVCVSLTQKQAALESQLSELQTKFDGLRTDCTEKQHDLEIAKLKLSTIGCDQGRVDGLIKEVEEAKNKTESLGKELEVRKGKQKGEKDTRRRVTGRSGLKNEEETDGEREEWKKERVDGLIEEVEEAKKRKQNQEEKADRRGRGKRKGRERNLASDG